MTNNQGPVPSGQAVGTELRKKAGGAGRDPSLCLVCLSQAQLQPCLQNLRDRTTLNTGPFCPHPEGSHMTGRPPPPAIFRKLSVHRLPSCLLHPSGRPVGVLGLSVLPRSLSVAGADSKLSPDGTQLCSWPYLAVVSDIVLGPTSAFSLEAQALDANPCPSLLPSSQAESGIQRTESLSGITQGLCSIGKCTENTARWM